MVCFYFLYYSTKVTNHEWADMFVYISQELSRTRAEMEYQVLYPPSNDGSHRFIFGAQIFATYRRWKMSLITGLCNLSSNSGKCRRHFLKVHHPVKTNFVKLF